MVRGEEPRSTSKYSRYSSILVFISEVFWAAILNVKIQMSNDKKTVLSQFTPKRSEVSILCDTATKIASECRFSSEQPNPALKLDTDSVRIVVSTNLVVTGFLHANTRTLIVSGV